MRKKLLHLLASCRVVPAGKVEVSEHLLSIQSSSCHRYMLPNLDTVQHFCLNQAAKQVGVGLTLASMGMAAFADGAVPGAGVGPVGEVSGG
jgi:hypothetical protein